MDNTAIQKLLKTLGSKGFLGLLNHHDFTRSRVVVIPFGLEKTVSYGKGSDRGPAALIEASHQVELFDEAFGNEPYKGYGITTLRPFPLPRSHRASLNLLADLTTELLQRKKFPVILGGEHSIIDGSARGVNAVYGNDFNILYFDAHTDLRPSFQGNSLSHASALYRALPHAHRAVVLGVRNTSRVEQRVIKKYTRQRRLKVFFAEDIVLKRKPNYLEDTTAFLKDKPVYLSFDVDVFDLSVISSSTGTPEPGGLGWYDILTILSAAAKELNIIGAEFVEFLPRDNNHAPDFAVAKLIYKFLNLQFGKQH